MEQHQHHHAAPLEQHHHHYHHHASPLRPPVGVQDQHDQAALHIRPPNPPIKVRLNSNCMECHVKLKKKLQKMSGVNDVDVVPEQGGTVTVSGSIDSKTLMEVIRNNYRRATLLCPFDQKEPSGSTVSKRKTCSASSSSDDDSRDRQDDNIAVTNRDTDAVPSEVSESKEEQKTMNRCIMTCLGKMRCFGKTSKPAAKSPTPPPPRPSPVPEPKPPIGKPRPGFLPGMLLMPPPPPPPLPYGYSGKPPQPSAPYGFLGRPPAPPPPYGYLQMPPLPPGYGNPFPMSPQRSNPMVHYTIYTDNYR